MVNIKFKRNLIINKRILQVEPVCFIHEDIKLIRGLLSQCILTRYVNEFYKSLCICKGVSPVNIT